MFSPEYWNGFFQNFKSDFWTALQYLIEKSKFESNIKEIATIIRDDLNEEWNDKIKEIMANNEVEIENKNKQIRSLESKISSLESKISSLESKISSLEKEVANTNNKNESSISTNNVSENEHNYHTQESQEGSSAEESLNKNDNHTDSLSSRSSDRTIG